MPKASKREQLLDAAKELLWEVGYEAMSPRDIQTRSAARPGSLYHHFPSKLALAGEAMSELAEKDIARIHGVFSSDAPPMETVERYLLAKRDAMRGCRFGRLVNEASIEHDELRGPVKAFFEAVRTHLAQTLSRAQDEGILSPDLDAQKLSVTLLALVQGGAVLARAYKDEGLAQEAIEGALSLLSEAARRA
ncbi:MAG: TetR/AcrR family transcriptional regulator [Parafilimonas terrae]|nr:TetR/AcrR family transcriptional regulator [Parafilimonas terrae]